jgi:hypothetical protein
MPGLLILMPELAEPSGGFLIHRFVAYKQTRPDLSHHSRTALDTVLGQ